MSLLTLGQLAQNNVRAHDYACCLMREFLDGEGPVTLLQIAHACTAALVAFDAWKDALNREARKTPTPTLEVSDGR